MKTVLQSNRRALFVSLRLLGFILFCVVVLYVYELFPRFITLSVSLPRDDYRSQVWTYPTYSVIRPGRTRYFSWREFAVLSYESVPEKESRQSILDHFDKQLLMQGWIRSEYDPNSYANCYDEKIFAEAAFLRPSQDFSQDGFVMYKRKAGFSLISSKVSDEICLAVWKHWDNVPSTFNVVISTIKPSPFTWIVFRDELQALQ
ncbi:MAG: hypothetical protein HND47_17870 [Chloroflexi bacterium]|nr:hypothetical protein [Chloroflexota bacterium]